MRSPWGGYSNSQFIPIIVDEALAADKKATPGPSDFLCNWRRSTKYGGGVKTTRTQRYSSIQTGLKLWIRAHSRLRREPGYPLQFLTVFPLLSLALCCMPQFHCCRDTRACSHYENMIYSSPSHRTSGSMGRAFAFFQAFRAANRRFDKTANFNVVDKQSLSPKTEVLGKPLFRVCP
jgi:hypothetical protein